MNTTCLRPGNLVTALRKSRPSEASDNPVIMHTSGGSQSSDASYTDKSAERTDEDLLRQCAAEDRRGLEELTRRYQSAVFGFLYRLTGSYEDAEDATLDVFLRAWRNAGRFQYRAKVSTWLYRIALNMARDMHSRKRARPQEPWPEDEEVVASLAVGSAEQDALESLERDEHGRELRGAIDRLSASDKELIVLYYLQDYDYDEIQAITGMSYTVLKTRLARARQRLRRHLEKARLDGNQ